MPSVGRRTGSIAVALVAAWLLVLQSVLTAFAFGDGPQPVQLDVFGNVICTHDGAAELPAGDPHQQPMPSCCTFGCIMAGTVFSPPPTAFALAHAVNFEAVLFSVPFAAPALFPREHAAANPRAPPPAA